MSKSCEDLPLSFGLAVGEREWSGGTERSEWAECSPWRNVVLPTARRKLRTNVDFLAVVRTSGRGVERIGQGPEGIGGRQVDEKRNAAVVCPGERFWDAARS